MSINDANRPFKKCGGPDLNRRTPAGPDPESGAFDLARQPPPKMEYESDILLLWR